jgi:hypothetical protein
MVESMSAADGKIVSQISPRLNHGRMSLVLVGHPVAQAPPGRIAPRW